MDNEILGNKQIKWVFLAVQNIQCADKNICLSLDFWASSKWTGAPVSGRTGLH